MKKADFEARIKRIEITNRVLKNGGRQAIRVVLDDIALTNENLLELRQFGSSESVAVTIEPAELPVDGGSEEQIASFVELSEEGLSKVQGRVVKDWKL